jgi:hypothetical protein
VADSENFDFQLEHHIAGDVGERVRTIISAAEATAQVIKREAEQEAESRRRLAEAERTRYLEAARAEIDDLVRQRVARINELSESLVEGAERLLSEFADAHQLRRQLDRTVGSLAEAAEQLAAEGRSGWSVRTPAPGPGPAEREAMREREAAGEPEPRFTREEPPAAEVVAETVIEPVPDPVVEAAPEPEARESERDGGEAAAERPRLREVPPNGDSGSEKDDDTLAARLVALQMAVAGSPRGEVEEHLRVTFDLDDTTSILNDVFGTEAPPFAR